MIEYGYCHCGCGEKTNVAPFDRPTRGWVKGEPMRYVKGHHRRSSPLEYLEDENGCWIWQRGRQTNGYGLSWIGSRPVPAHRLLYEREIGPIPQGLDLDHLCRVPLCVNPAHLEPVTRRENARRGNGTKLTPEKVRAVRSATGTNADVAERFGLEASYVSRVRRHLVWSDVA